MSKPAFDPTKPFEAVNVKPAFDPSKPFEEVDAKPPTIINEMHPDITLSDRAIVKNLSTDQPDVAINYLKKQHPNLEFRDNNGEIIAKGKNETAWKPLDPKGFDLTSWQGIKEVGKDITDVGADIAGGIATTAGTAAGALAGAGAGGIGAIPGGLAGGTAAGAGVETVRQALGKLAGLDQDFSGTDIAISGVAGGVAAPLTGFGTSAGKLVAKGVAPSVARFMEEGALPMAGKAAYGKVKGVSGKLAEMLSGVKGEEYSRFLRNPNVMENIAELGEENVASDILSTVGKAVSNKRKSVGADIQSHVRESGKRIDLTNAKNILDEEIFKIESKSSQSTVNEAQLENLKVLRDKLFTRKVQGVNAGINPANVEVEDTFDMKDILAAAADNFKGRNETKSGAENYLIGLAKTLGKEVKDKVEKVIPESGPLAKSYKESLNAETILRKKFGLDGNPLTQLEKSLTTLDNIDSRKNRGLKSMLEKLGPEGKEALETAKDLRAYRYLADPSNSPISRGGTVSTGRSAVGRTLGGAVGAAVGSGVVPSESRGTGALAGGGLGAVAGSTLASPMVLKQLIKAALKAEGAVKATSKGMSKTKLNQILKQSAIREATNNVWNSMQENK